MNQNTHTPELPRCGDPECDHGETCACDIDAFVRWLRAENYRLCCAQAAPKTALELERVKALNAQLVEALKEVDEEISETMSLVETEQLTTAQVVQIFVNIQNRSRAILAKASEARHE